MAEVERDYDPASFAGKKLDHHRHVCAFINSQVEQQRILDPFVIEGLDRGEKMVYVVDPSERGNLVRQLRGMGLDVASLLGQGQFEVRTWSETYLRGGRFDQEAMLVLLDELLGGSGSTRI